MKEIVDILQANPVVYLATVDQGKPRVRAFQFCLADDGKLWFCTAKSKKVYAQLKAAPYVEFAAATPEFATLRVSGEVKFSDDQAVKTRILDMYPSIKGLYGDAGNPDFTLFYLEHGQAVFWDFSGQPARETTF